MEYQWRYLTYETKIRVHNINRTLWDIDDHTPPLLTVLNSIKSEKIASILKKTTNSNLNLPAKK